MKSILEEGKIRCYCFEVKYFFSKNSPSCCDMNIIHHDFGHDTKSELSITLQRW